MITNDDGILSEGLRAAVHAARPFGDVLVAAPVRQQTAMGRGYPRTEDLGIINAVDLGIPGTAAYAIHGSPGYCTAFGILELAQRKPDLVISGINIGCNLGLSLTASGTLGAAFEAFSQDIPVLAVSLEVSEDELLSPTSQAAIFRTAQSVVSLWIGHVMNALGIHIPDHQTNVSDSHQKTVLTDSDDISPSHVPASFYRFLNINIPAGDVNPEDFLFTFVEQQNYYVLQKPPKRNRSEPFTLNFRIQVDEKKLHEGSDIHTVCKKRKISVTPLTMDLTRNTHSRF